MTWTAPLAREASRLGCASVVDFGLGKGFLDSAAGATVGGSGGGFGSAAGATVGVGDGLSGSSRIGAGNRCAVIISTPTVTRKLTVRFTETFSRRTPVSALRRGHGACRRICGPHSFENPPGLNSRPGPRDQGALRIRIELERPRDSVRRSGSPREQFAIVG